MRAILASIALFTLLGSARGAEKAAEAATMKAVRFHEFGGSEGLVLEDAPRPTPAKGEMLVRVHAAAAIPSTGRPNEARARERSVRTSVILVKPDAEELGKIAALVDAGKVQPIVSEVLPLSEARRAQEASETGHTRGKIVLEIVK